MWRPEDDLAFHRTVSTFFVTRPLVVLKLTSEGWITNLATRAFKEYVYSILYYFVCVCWGVALYTVEVGGQVSEVRFHF